MDRATLLWNLYNENCVYGRHHETQRATVATMLNATAAAILGLITFDKEITASDAPLATFLIALGFFGAVFQAKHYERYRAHVAQAKEFRDALDAAVASGDIKKLREAANNKHKAHFGILYDLRLSQMW